jgi:flagellar basal-body rod modification protein FlgD
MTTVAPVDPTSIQRQSQTATQQLSGNFDTFLTLLTTQLKNQDPLSPMDSNQFTQQLVQFSGVEQQINTNANLETLIGLSKNQAGANAVGYLGKTVTLTDGSGPLNDGSATWTYTLPTAANATQLTITDTSGRVVYTAPGELGAGDHTFVWNGEDNAGNQLPDGAYKLTVGSVDAAGQALTTTVKSQGTVTEVNLAGPQPMLMLGAMAVPISSAALISDPSGLTESSTSTLESITAPVMQAAGTAASILSVL